MSDKKNHLTFNKIIGHKRVIIEKVYPELDCGLYPIKRCVGDTVTVQADIFADGHDEVSADLLIKHPSEKKWQRIWFSLINNNRYQAAFVVEKIGLYIYKLQGWINEFKTLQSNMQRKLYANQDIAVDILIAIELIRKAINHSQIIDEQKKLTAIVHELSKKNNDRAIETILDDELTQIMSKPDFALSLTEYPHHLNVIVDRKKAAFSAWYELFPRSLSKNGKHGTFSHLIEHLTYIKELGFDVIYLPPVHPIGMTNRRGKNNSINFTVNDPGSPWAIGNVEGGHKAIHPQLGTLDDFKSFIQAANDLDIEIAMDYALQCSPDHPYLREHREWFKHRPDNTLQYAENLPKKYQDIYPLYFGCEQWQSLWSEAKSILDFWIAQGIKIFRVDNPHTKPFVFWEWLIHAVKQEHEEVIFLSEAFTKPKIMYLLAKIGFSQSYTYFSWRNTKTEMIDYFKELTSFPIIDFYRPNLWPNTPDILTSYLQNGGRSAFMTRFILAATLGTNYGIYGPAFELCENQPLHEDSEEYLNSEKYEIHTWNLKNPNSLKDLISKINKIRKEHPALQNMDSLQFHHNDNSEIICYSKQALEDVILVVVNLDYKYKQSTWLEIPIEKLKLNNDNFIVHDLLTDENFHWHGNRNYVELDPNKLTAHIFQVKGI